VNYQPCIEIPTPGGNNPTHRIDYGDPIESLDEAIAWIKKPPRTLTLREDYFLTARHETKFGWLDELGVRHGLDRVAAFGKVIDRGKPRLEIVVCTENGITVSDKGVGIAVLGLNKKQISRLRTWRDKNATAKDLLRVATNVQRQLLVTAACACAKTVEHLVKEGEERPRIAIEIAEDWTKGEATLTEVKTAYDAAYEAAPYDAAYEAAAYKADAYYAAEAAYYAYHAAEAAYYASVTTHYDSFTDDAPYHAVLAAHADDSAAATRSKLIAIVRSTIKLPDVLWGELIC